MFFLFCTTANADACCQFLPESLGFCQSTQVVTYRKLAEQSTFLDTAYLIIYEKLPSHAELRRFSDLLAKHELMHEDMKFHFEGFPPNALNGRIKGAAVLPLNGGTWPF
jgi:citrate synthase